jgi:hypothetical protein
MDALTLEKVANRRKCLSRYRLWDLPKPDNIDGWQQQFSTPEDKRIAMVILDALIVRSKESAVSSIFYMLCSVLPNLLNEIYEYRDNLGAMPYDLLHKKTYTSKFRIQRLEPPFRDPAGGQSSDDIIRDLRYTYTANEKYFKMPQGNIPHVLLVDEFSGSGQQAKDAISDWKNRLSPKTKISAFFMAIHKKGLTDLQNQFNDVNFYAAEVLGDESCLLNHIKEYFKLESIESVESKLLEFTKRNFIFEKKVKPLGYKKMCLCFKPPYTACNNMAGAYLLRTKKNKVRLFERGL